MAVSEVMGQQSLPSNTLYHLSPLTQAVPIHCSMYPSIYAFHCPLSVAFLFHISPRLCPFTAGCSPPSMSSIVFCLLLSCFTFQLGFVHPLQDAAFHQCLQLSSVCCFPVPGGSLLPCYVVLPSSTWSSLDLFPLPFCAAFGPPIVLHFCYMSSPSLLLFQCVFYNVNYVCSFPDL